MQLPFDPFAVITSYALDFTALLVLLIGLGWFIVHEWRLHFSPKASTTHSPSIQMPVVSPSVLIVQVTCSGTGQKIELYITTIYL